MTTLLLFPDLRSTAEKDERSGTFVDNMKLPIHRWFKYSAGFSVQWVENVLADYRIKIQRIRANRKRRVESYTR